MKKYARSWFKQFQGLMFDDTEDMEIEFVFKKPTRFGASIHTCFMKYPIHVEWLDMDRKVIEEKNFNPWTINHTPKKPAMYIIEKRIRKDWK